VGTTPFSGFQSWEVLAIESGSPAGEIPRVVVFNGQQTKNLFWGALSPKSVVFFLPFLREGTSPTNIGFFVFCRVSLSFFHHFISV